MRIFFIVILLIFGFSPFAATGADDLVLSRAVLTDPAGTLTIEDVIQGDFQPTTDILSKGYTDAAHWLRLVVRAPEGGGELVLRIRPTFLDEITLYEADANNPGLWNTYTTGDRTPFLERDHSTIALGFVIKPSLPETTYYLRLQTTSASIMHVQALMPHAATQRDLRLNLFQFFYLGLMLGLLCLAINDYATYRDHLVLWFVAYQCTYIVYSLALLGYLAPLIPSAPVGFLDKLTSFAVCGITLVGLLFNRALLRLFDPPRGVRFGFDTLLLLAMIVPFIMLLGHFRLALHINALLVLAVAPMMVIVAFSARSEVAPGRHLLRMIYVLMAISLFISIVGFMGWIEAVEWNLQATLLYGLFSTCLMFVLLHLRSRQLLRESAAAKIDLLLVEQMLKIEQAQHEKKNRFMAMLSHELKTPLSLIRLTLGLQNLSDTDKQNAQKSVLDIDAIVERCLQSDQLEQGQLTLTQHPCQIADLLEELCAESTAPQRFIVHCDALPEIQTDYFLLRTAVNNLIDNALKYAQPLSPIHIEAKLIEHQGQSGICVTITNQPGTAGLPDAQQVFNKYYRSAGAYSKTGSGLGLYLVQGIIELLGGWVRYCPSANEVRFKLWIPL
ncbi:MAG: 7TM-DISM domain-containing protein [Nitrincola lacisaponensis]|uniref:sensor histidine kinase n=1 Tax=Nitrincola lacisaponensis TaxID=267850 RepID=UPI003918DE30